MNRESLTRVSTGLAAAGAAVGPEARLLSWIYNDVLLEPVYSVMERKMMLETKERAERSATVAQEHARTIA